VFKDSYVYKTFCILKNAYDIEGFWGFGETNCYSHKRSSSSFILIISSFTCSVQKWSNTSLHSKLTTSFSGFVIAGWYNNLSGIVFWLRLALAKVWEEGELMFERKVGGPFLSC